LKRASRYIVSCEIEACKLYEGRFGSIVNYIVRDALSYAIHKSSRRNKSRHRDESFPLTMSQAGSNYSLKKFPTIPAYIPHVLCSFPLIVQLSNYTFANHACDHNARRNFVQHLIKRWKRRSERATMNTNTDMSV